MSVKTKHNNCIDHYAVLEVHFGASANDIKKQYRKLVLKYHPDKNADVDRSIFHGIQESYEALTDDDWRNVYDRFFYADVQRQETLRKQKEQQEEILRKRQ